MDELMTSGKLNINFVNRDKEECQELEFGDQFVFFKLKASTAQVGFWYSLKSVNKIISTQSV